MSQVVPVPSGLAFLPLAEEVIPLLKRGVVPLTAPEDSQLPGYLPLGSASRSSVSQQDYAAHMQAEFERLPQNLRSLLTLDAFLQQAESKRADIEAALIRQRKAAEEKQQGRPAEWLWQHFYSDAHCALAWGQSGFNTIWLGVDASQWDGAELQPVQYVQRWPVSYPQRLLCDAVARSGLMQQRLILPRAELDKSVVVGGRRQWLLRLPPKALRVVLIGAGCGQPLRQRLHQFLRQDFRYQRIPLGEMTVLADGMAWQFQARPFTRSEKA
ncbi:MAG: hypothetical protein KYX62_03080 [Pseudomonadota bacterium]|nr:hypothetical protein [Pseudomonadota bacterium]